MKTGLRTHQRASKQRHTQRIGNRTHRLCASIIITKKTRSGPKVLIVHKPRRRDAWQIPQGGVEFGESVMQAGKRELHEETNIIIKDDLLECPQIYQYNYPAEFTRREKPLYKGQCLLFLAAELPEGEHVRVDQKELDAFLWVHPRTIGRYIRRKDYRRLVQKAVFWAIEKSE